MNMGFLSVLPIIVMVVLVIVTKKVFESLLIAVSLVFILKDGAGFIDGCVQSIYTVFAGDTYPWVLLMLTLFGALVQLLLESKGVDGFRRIALKYIKSEKSSLVFTWILGLILCIDDYINDLAIGPSVRSITDKYKVPREGIGFIILAMGVPICALLPVSAMAVFVFGVMQDFGVSPADSNMLTEYLKVIPFLVYPILIVLIALLVALGVLPKIGPLKKLYAAAKESGADLTGGETGEEEESEGSLIDFILPVLTIVIVMLLTNDLVVSVTIALAVCFALYIPRKKMTIGEFFKNVFEGIHSMVDILVILLFVFAFVDGLEQIGFSEYVIGVTTPFLVGGVIPMLSFIIVALLVFGGVDYWAVMLLIAPITVPLASTFGVNQYLTMAAVVSGAICGATSCYFGEQMLMCSQAVEKDSVELASAVFPYAAIGFVLTAGIYCILGFAL